MRLVAVLIALVVASGSDPAVREAAERVRNVGVGCGAAFSSFAAVNARAARGHLAEPAGLEAAIRTCREAQNDYVGRLRGLPQSMVSRYADCQAGAIERGVALETLQQALRGQRDRRDVTDWADHARAARLDDASCRKEIQAAGVTP